MKNTAALPALITFLLLHGANENPGIPNRRSDLSWDFDGRWSGTWNWSATNFTSLEISGTRAKVAGLPIVRDPVAGTLVVVSTEGTATFESAHGTKGAP